MSKHRFGTMPSDAELSAYVDPFFKMMTKKLRITTWAKYGWKDGYMNGCDIGDASKIMFGRSHFAHCQRLNKPVEAMRAVIHEGLHGCGMEHDYNLRYISNLNRDRVSTALAHLILFDAPSDLATRALRKLQRAKKKTRIRREIYAGMRCCECNEKLAKRGQPIVAMCNPCGKRVRRDTAARIKEMHRMRRKPAQPLR